MINTENKRRSVGCHMSLTVPPLPNVGVSPSDRPHIAWVYRGLIEQHDDCEIIDIQEALQGVITIMEAMRATADVREFLGASADILESQAGIVDVLESLSANVDVREALNATVIINPC